MDIEATDILNAVYAERNLCVALLADFAKGCGMNVGIKNHVGEDWEDGWRNVLFIDLPTGQISWHLQDSELVNLPHIGHYTGEWDNHTTEEKYERLKKFLQMPIEAE